MSETAETYTTRLMQANANHERAALRQKYEHEDFVNYLQRRMEVLDRLVSVQNAAIGMLTEVTDVGHELVWLDYGEVQRLSGPISMCPHCGTVYQSRESIGESDDES